MVRVEHGRQRFARPQRSRDCDAGHHLGRHHGPNQHPDLPHVESATTTRLCPSSLTGRARLVPSAAPGMWLVGARTRRRPTSTLQRSTTTARAKTWCGVASTRKLATTTTLPTPTTALVNTWTSAVNAAVRASRWGRAIAKATSLTPSACAAAIAPPTWMATACATTRTIALASWTPAAFATVLVRCSTAVVTWRPQVHATATGTCWMPLAFAAATAPPTWTAMACATTQDECVGVRGRMRRVQWPWSHVRVWMQHDSCRRVRLRRQPT